jgi:predicted RND superfamily exporter protein
MKRTLRFLQLTSLVVFLFLAGASIFFLPRLQFTFDFSQFFPEEDPDLTFYESFMEEFGTDDNFLLVAITNGTSVFETDFLERFDAFSQAADEFPYVTEVASLTRLSYPLKTTFGYTTLPVIHVGDRMRYGADWKKIKEDALFTNVLIDTAGQSLVVALETEDNLDHSQSEALLGTVRKALKENRLDDHHLMGRAFFYEAIVDMQRDEVLKTSLVAAILVFTLLWFFYRSWPVVIIAVISIAMGLLLFLGMLAFLGKELNAMAAFYPVLMLIVGTSDVIHISDSYIRKIGMGMPKYPALTSCLREVGLTTLLTSLTTAVGFVTLLSSRLTSIQEFGINAALGVLVAYFTVIFFTCPLLLMVPNKTLARKEGHSSKWTLFLERINTYTLSAKKTIVWGTLAFFILCLIGISIISTNYEFKNSLPANSKIADDFLYFQEHYAGFRPLEIAITAVGDTKVTDFSAAQEIAVLEDYLNSQGAIGNLQSPNLPFKIIHKANHLNASDSLKLPHSATVFERYKRDLKKLGRRQMGKFVNASETRARINGKLQDVGTDSLQVLYRNIATFAKQQLDSSLIAVKVTGKSLLLDKNAGYIRKSLLEGLLIGLVIIGAIMAMVFQDLRMILISLVPNVLPIMFAGAVLGYLGIPLEASLSVVFAIVFGIAVDDTIHFLAKYKLGLSQGYGKEEALQKTFVHTGKALVVTTILLFFGFLVLLFSQHQPSVTIGIIISVTLVTALFLDLLLLPILIRRFLK